MEQPCESTRHPWGQGLWREVRDIISAHEESGGKFAMSMDSWNNRKRCYLAVHLHYVDAGFQLKELCVGVLPLAGRTDGAAYAHSMNKMLEDVGVEPTDFLAVVSDHDARGVFSEVQQTSGWGSALGAGGAAVGVPSK